MLLKKILISLILIALLSNTCFAGCDYSQIKPSQDGQTFIYTKELHLCVGNLVQDSKVKDQQVQDYQKAITLKDLAIKASDDRANLWSSTSQSLEDRLQKVDSLQSKNEWLYFSLGVASTFLAGFMAAKLIHG